MATKTKPKQKPIFMGTSLPTADAIAFGVLAARQGLSKSALLKSLALKAVEIAGMLEPETKTSAA